MEIEPSRASSVILVRDTPNGVETFLIKRHEASSFMGGFYAFPGGNVEAADSSDELHGCVEGLSLDAAQDCLGKGVAPEIALAHWVAGIREVFEEVGVLFARDEGGTPISFADKNKRKLFEEYRELLNKGEMTFARRLIQEHLTLTASSLIHYAHWITPLARSIRYDTHFFLAQLPTGQTPSVDHRETIEGIWQRPEEAVKENTAGGCPLTPPALCILQGLASFSSVREIRKYCTGRRLSDPILPILIHVQDTETILLPGDKLYTEYGGEALEHCNNLPQPLRLVLKDGRWLPA